MCGIAGICNRKAKRLDLSLIKRMTDTISHRGPDAEGHWLDNEGMVALGHRRLSILDLSDAGSQPMHKFDFSIVFNGEIYNYLELRSELIKEDYHFESETDTEVLLAMYHRHGQKMLKFLDGMFAFAIWDKTRKQLFCARDRFGEKPFFYTRYQDQLIFASEMKALFEVDNQLTSTDMVQVSKYLLLGESPNEAEEDTFYGNVKRLPPAHFLIYEEGHVIVRSYWELEITNPKNISLCESSEEFFALISESVKKRLRSDVEVGSSLSGGLDSSSIVGLIKNLIGNEGCVNTFSARFKNFAKDEGTFMQKMADHIDAKSHYTYPNGEEMIGQLESIFHYQEEPFPSTSILIQHEVFKLAKESKVTVILDGQGADEILAGYHHYFPTFFNELHRSNKLLYKSELDHFLTLHELNSKEYKRKLLLKRLLGAGGLRLYRRIIMSNIQNRKRILSQEVVQQATNSKRNNAEHFHSLKEHLKIESTSGGLQTLLRYADRNSMAHSREVRLPFLDHRLVEFCFGLSNTHKINKGWTKYVLRKSIEKLLPTEITWRRDKIGYEAPQEEWMKSKDYQDILNESSKKLLTEGLLRRGFDVKKKSNLPVSWNVVMTGLILK